MSSNIDAICAAWLKAKRAENKARDERIAVEAELAQAFDVPGEGSKTHQTEGHKVTLTQPVRRTLDAGEWERVKSKIAINLHPVKTKIEADAAGCKYLAANDPKTWAVISSAFATKPGKIGVKVEAK